MRVAYFDAGAGVSGDMMLGALVDAGLGLDGLRQVLAGLDLEGYVLSAEETRRAGFRACSVRVTLGKEEHHHGGQDAHGGRRISEIMALLDRSKLPDQVRETAKRVFHRLGEAEGRVHGSAAEDIHLHEVGAVDALVDVVGSVGGLAVLGVERVVFSPLRLGYGTVRCAHGILPVPAPAVAELIRGVPVYAGEVEGEMVTPTGAALATTLAQSFGSMPPMRPRAIGLGAGAADRALPNVLRLFLGETDHDAEAEELVTEELTVLEANLDDMNPEFFEHLCDRLRAQGALDIWLTPIQMKKNRPAVLLSILAQPAEVPGLREIVFRESTTLGLRSYQVRRYALARESITVSVGTQETVRVKIGRTAGKICQLAPEYEDCRLAALRLSWPLKRVYQEAASSAWAKFTRPDDRV